MPESCNGELDSIRGLDDDERKRQNGPQRMAAGTTKECIRTDVPTSTAAMCGFNQFFDHERSSPCKKKRQEKCRTLKVDSSHRSAESFALA